MSFYLGPMIIIFFFQGGGQGQGPPEYAPVWGDRPRHPREVGSLYGCSWCCCWWWIVSRDVDFVLSHRLPRLCACTQPADTAICHSESSSLCLCLCISLSLSISLSLALSVSDADMGDVRWCDV